MMFTSETINFKHIMGGFTYDRMKGGTGREGVGVSGGQKGGARTRLGGQGVGPDHLHYQ